MSMRMMCSVFLLVILLSITASAERTITVNGKSEVRFVPDEVSITVVIENFDEKMKTARLQTDKQVSEILSIVTDYGVKPGHIKTSHMLVDKMYKGNFEKGKLQGYLVSKTISITLTKMSEFDKIITDVLELGAETVYNISFKSSKYSEYRKEALTLATRAAKNKAVAMATELDQSLGIPLKIQENFAELAQTSNFNARSHSPDSRHRDTGLYNLASSYGENISAGSANIAPGQLTINALVTVEFLME